MNLVRILSALLLVSLASTSWGKPFKGRPDVTCELDDPAAGLIVVSASVPEAEVASDPTGIWFHFNTVGRGNFSNQKLMITRQQLVIPITSDFSGTFGRLYVLKLAAGDYEFRTWTFTQGQQGDRTAVRKPAKKPATLPFKVVAGRVTYLGSFAPSLNADRALSVAIEDQAGRDLQVFAQKCAKVEAQRIDTQLLKTGAWN